MSKNNSNNSSNDFLDPYDTDGIGNCSNSVKDSSGNQVKNSGKNSAKDGTDNCGKNSSNESNSSKNCR